MAQPEDFGVRDRPHLDFSNRRETAAYEFPPRRRDPKPLRDSYTAHAAALLNQVATALGALPSPSDDARLAIEGLKRGTVVEVSTLQPAEESRVKAIKIPTRLEFPTQEITVLRSTRNDDRTESALLFVPDDAREFLRDRITEYGNPNIGNRRRQDVDRFEAVERVRATTATDLFVGAVDFASTQADWWEVWLRLPDEQADRVLEAARTQSLDVHADRLVFPDTVVAFVHATPQVVATFASRVPGAVAEIRRATGTIEPFLELGEGPVTQHDFVDELVGRIDWPATTSPVVCTLDSGVSAAHPLIANALRGAWTYDAAWGTNDHVPQGGHGTALASLILYGDLEPLMSDQSEVVLAHGVESMKLLPPNGFPPTQPPSYGVVTQGAVALVETNSPNPARAFCLASSATDFPPARPSSWSGALDQLAAGSMPGDRVTEKSAADHPKRLVLVATGNVDGGMRHVVTASHPLEDPAQSWNAISVGGFTTKDKESTDPPGLKPVVAANNRSPFSRGSQSLPDDLTPIKPEVLFEAGNMVADASDFCGWNPVVSLLAAGSDVVAEPLVPFWATSAAVGVAGHFMGQLQAALPQYWPETLRALTVQSADWPQPIRRKLVGRGAHWKSGSKAEKQNILREVGYGVPDARRAVLSARNDVTMIAEAEIQPFALNEDGRVIFYEMHFYDLPWPKSALEQLENEIVTMKVTLSYFIEPNLTGKAATRPDTYRSFGLRFAMKKRLETSNQFRSRITASQENDGSGPDGEASYWLLGPKAMQAGSLHCDLWRGRAVELALHDEIAVYPVGGWWKSHVGQQRSSDKGRYSLVVSVSALGQSIDLHTEVSNLVQVESVEVPV